MKTQQEQTDLNKMIIDSGILSSIKHLRDHLEIYQRLDKAKKHLYAIQIEFSAVFTELDGLSNILKYLRLQAKQWEKTE